jgi:hypothetical protein
MVPLKAIRIISIPIGLDIPEELLGSNQEASTRRVQSCTLNTSCSSVSEVDHQRARKTLAHPITTISSIFWDIDEMSLPLCNSIDAQ